MERYQVLLSYDGTHFQGFQRLAFQNGMAQRTVQGVVEEALRQLNWQGQSILAAGRTDAGVHASGQVIAFDLDWKHTLQALMKALNARLPEDVAVLDVRRASAEFHPRYDARARRYAYRIFCEEVRRPLWERYAWRVFPAVKMERLAQASLFLIGTHDFRMFGSPPKRGGSTIRTIYRAGWEERDGFLVFDIIANAFLLHMVRRIVATLVRIGQERMEVEAIAMFLSEPFCDEHGGLFSGFSKRAENLRKNVKVQGLAPPQGLHLVEVDYGAPWGE